MAGGGAPLPAAAWRGVMPNCSKSTRIQCNKAWRRWRCLSALAVDGDGAAQHGQASDVACSNCSQSIRKLGGGEFGAGAHLPRQR